MTMKMIVGLGNPGKEYSSTRHNIGYMVLDNYLGDVSWKEKMESYIYTNEVNGEQIIYIKPTTYMNLSGIAVKKALNYYKIDVNDILVIQDDLDMEIGKYKLMFNRGDGGHNGIKNIISVLHTQDIARIKIGISMPKDALMDHVLGKFSKKDKERNDLIEDIHQRSLRAAPYARPRPVRKGQIHRPKRHRRKAGDKR